MRRTVQRFQAIAAGLKQRKGSVLVLAAFCLILLMAFTAFVVDVGYIAYSKAQLQNVTDAAVLSAALELDMMGDQGDVQTNAVDSALAVAAINPGGTVDVTIAGAPEPMSVVQTSDVELGRQDFNPTTGKYTFSFGPGNTPYNVIKVTGKRAIRNSGGNDLDMRLPLFFAPVIGHEYAELEVTSIASFQPRDVMLVIDLSASMNDDSELKSIDDLGFDAITANQEEIWDEMTVAGAMASGVGAQLPFDADYLTVEGVPHNDANEIPHITVTWKGKTVDVESTKNLSKVKLKYTNGQTKTFYSLSGLTGSFSGSKEIESVWVRSWENDYISDSSGNGERFDFEDDDIRDALGLGSVSYPFSSGSWGSYFSYVKSSSQLNDAGMKYKFGGQTLVNYWLDSKPKNNQTEDLWRASAQPMTALKDAVYLFVDYLQSVQAEDKVGLSGYNNSAQDALLELGLSDNLNQIRETTEHRQAGHYDYYTNIGAGMRIAREELIANARPKALRLMIVITDGIANRSSTGASPAQSALDEAYMAAEYKIKIMTVSLGANADADLMQEIADITGGEHFNVPGGQSVSDYTTELENHFGIIAADRPLKLIDEKYEAE